MGSLVKAFIIKTKLICESACTCLFSFFGFYHFKNVMSFLFMETYITLLTHFLKCSEKNDNPSFGCELHLL